MGSPAVEESEAEEEDDEDRAEEVEDHEGAAIARLLRLDLVQLHGRESAGYLARLRADLPVPLIKALAARDQYPTVSSAMQNEFVTVDSLEMLETAFAKLKDCNCHTLPVTLNGKLAGLMTMDNLGEYMRIQAAMKS